MGMNLMKMLGQVKNMQQKVTAMKQELENLEITGKSGSGSVQVTTDGRGQFKSVKIAPEAINPENPSAVDKDILETLEDLIAAAMKDATEQSAKEGHEKLMKITGGIKIPGLDGLGF